MIRLLDAKVRKMKNLMLWCTLRHHPCVWSLAAASSIALFLACLPCSCKGDVDFAVLFMNATKSCQPYHAHATAVHNSRALFEGPLIVQFQKLQQILQVKWQPVSV